MGSAGGFHENLDRHDPKRSSDRSFGLVMSAAFTVMALLPLRKGHPIRWWALVLATAFLTTALTNPKILRKLNQAWTYLGSLLEKITGPLIMGLMFYLLLTPVAIILKLLGKDLLRLKFDSEAQTYWIKREVNTPENSSTSATMSNQF